MPANYRRHARGSRPACLADENSRARGRNVREDSPVERVAPRVNLLERSGGVGARLDLTRSPPNASPVTDWWPTDMAADSGLLIGIDAVEVSSSSTKPMRDLAHRTDTRPPASLNPDR